MRKYNHLLALLLVLCLVFSLVPAVSAEEAAPLANSDEVVIYYTNDIHTYIDKTLSYDNIADLKEKTAEQAADVLLVDAGDHIQGTAYGSMDKGKTIIDLMNAAGYDLATLGNHEFDYTMEGTMNAIDWADFPYVSANFYNEKDGVVGDTVLDAYEVFSLGEFDVAFIGVTTPETFTKSTPAYFQDEDGNYIYGIAGGEDGSELYAAVQAAIDKASQEADLVIALAHLGDDTSSQPWTSEELIANTTGLDALIDGHSHSTVEMKEVTDREGNTVVLTQTGEYFNAIGRMSIAADGTITTSLITEYEGSNAEVKAIKDAWVEEIDNRLGEVIGCAEVTLDNYDESGRLVRKYETNTGNLAADALYYLFDSMNMDVDIAIMNGGGVRSKTITGEITYKTCKEIHTFGNVACLQTVTGQQILDALEWGAREADTAECGGFLHVAGLTYDINYNIESTVQSDEKGVWTGGPTGEYRVQNVRVWDKELGKYVELDLDADYNLAGYNYTLRDLGDGFAMFDGAVNVLDYVMEDYMVLANYIQSFENGTITAADGPVYRISADIGSYDSVYGEGRINYVAFTDLESNKWYYPYVEISAESGLVEGYPDGTFLPDKDVTRAEFATMLYRVLLGEPIEYESPFADLTNSEAWYYDEVVSLAALGIIEGRPTTVNGQSVYVFDPAATITREEMVTMVYRAQTLLEEVLDFDYVPDDLSRFADAGQVSGWAKDAMQWAVGANIVNGMTSTTLVPQGETSRAQVCKVLLLWALTISVE